MSRTETSAELTPLIREAWPMLPGRIWASFPWPPAANRGFRRNRFRRGGGGFQASLLVHSRLLAAEVAFIFELHLHLLSHQWVKDRAAGVHRGQCGITELRAAQEILKPAAGYKGGGTAGGKNAVDLLGRGAARSGSGGSVRRPFAPAGQ